MPFEKPLRIYQVADDFVVKDMDGMELACVYFDDRRAADTISPETTALDTADFIRLNRAIYDRVGLRRLASPQSVAFRHAVSK
jgi:hypothetical protein